MNKVRNIYRAGRVVDIGGKSGVVMATSELNGTRYASVQLEDGRILSITVRKGRTKYEETLPGQVQIGDATRCT